MRGQSQALVAVKQNPTETRNAGPMMRKASSHDSDAMIPHCSSRRRLATKPLRAVSCFCTLPLQRYFKCLYCYARYRAGIGKGIPSIRLHRHRL